MTGDRCRPRHTVTRRALILMLLVICAAVEVAGGRKRDAFAAIDEKIRANTAEMLERAERGGIPPREAAVQMARERVDAAMHYTRFD